MIYDFSDEASAESFVMLAPDKNRTIILTDGVDTPYRCIGGTIYALQRLGYRGIGFISEPPEDASQPPK